MNIIKKSSDLLARIHMDDPFAPEILALSIAEISHSRSLVIVCVGTDRSTGDSLGPLIGSKLGKNSLNNITVYGCLDEPVHALNLDYFVQHINENHAESVVLAIDACLGKSDSIGYISFKEGPLKPGIGVNKALPEIGHYHIIGIVNVGGLMEYFVLQNTRLSLVMRMSDVIAQSIVIGVKGLSINRA